MTAPRGQRHPRDREARRRAELARLMRERVGLAPAPVPVPLHKMAQQRAGRAAR
jgi:hypothetical protein